MFAYVCIYVFIVVCYHTPVILVIVFFFISPSIWEFIFSNTSNDEEESTSVTIWDNIVSSFVLETPGMDGHRLSQ